MIPAILAKIGLPVLMSVIGEALGEIDSPVTKSAAKALAKVDSALAQGTLSENQMIEANRHAEKIAQIKIEESTLNLSEINKSLRAEVASQDKYVRRMRPTFGYLMALTWAAQMFAVAYVIVFQTDKAGLVMSAMSSLSAIWAVGLSVLGIYVYKRSEDKKLSERIFWGN